MEPADLSGKNIFITGASGFAGSFLCKELLARRAKLSALVNPADKELKLGGLEKNISIYKADIKDAAAVQDIIATINPEIIYHLAAINSVSYSVSHPREVLDVNFYGTLNLLEAAKFSGAKFIYISSAEIYAESDSPINENGKILPDSPYAVSKAAADHLVACYNKIYQLPTVIFRPFNIYGPENYKNVIFKFAEAAFAGKNLELDGGGSQAKDFIFIKDFIEALCLAAANLHAEGEIFNIGSGRSISIKDLAEKIIFLTRSPSKIIIKEARQASNKNFKCDSGKLKRILNWNASADLEKGLAETVLWIKSL